ncbi:uroporphyrinogen-III synthase Ups1 [Schizosaccharomyces japonicus yFS275]|uniref:Uroporphyrinogen-III synthase n=1 Tax=Schizosaccharomyces japonicus (strain yFS275 / FY16936) TaxID=402676 RepID=B6K1J4_SCHJY|nr:uroporphyrinogen-III synthase Ups1 [Schizosaccharomyces japonicus yFS275]EEB07815.1 uroporphyrinogen-III synthase Ups1 [Schizosaccharomyces japonicus yFS275]
MRTVLLLKNKSNGADEYELAFAKKNYKIAYLPLLTHTYIHETELRKCFQNLPSKYSGLIITSQRAIEFVNTILGDLNDEESSNIRKDIPVFILGHASDRYARTAGFYKRYGKDSGCAEKLADEIIEWYLKFQPQKPMLFLMGEKHRETLPVKLNVHRIPLTTLTIYKTTEVPNASDLINNCLDKDHSITWIVIFSPLQSVISVLRHCTVNIATIGPTTESHLLNNGIIPSVVAPKPEALSLAETIDVFDKAKPQEI